MSDQQTDTGYVEGVVEVVRIVPATCPFCGVVYGIPDWWIERRRHDHKTWTCINGCDMYFPKRGQR